jgi:hypothetical protein
MFEKIIIKGGQYFFMVFVAMVVGILYNRIQEKYERENRRKDSDLIR